MEEDLDDAQAVATMRASRLGDLGNRQGAAGEAAVVLVLFWMGLATIKRWWRRGESNPHGETAVKGFPQNTCDADHADSGSFQAAAGKVEQPSGNSASEADLSQHVGTPAGCNIEPVSGNRQPVPAKKPAVSSPSRIKAALEDPEFLAVVDRMAEVWPLPRAVLAGINASLNALVEY